MTFNFVHDILKLIQTVAIPSYSIHRSRCLPSPTLAHLVFQNHSCWPNVCEIIMFFGLIPSNPRVLRFIQSCQSPLNQLPLSHRSTYIYNYIHIRLVLTHMIYPAIITSHDMFPSFFTRWPLCKEVLGMMSKFTVEASRLAGGLRWGLTTGPHIVKLRDDPSTNKNN